MTRDNALALVCAFLLLAGMVFVWVAADARSISGEPYRPLAQGEFHSLVPVRSSDGLSPRTSREPAPSPTANPRLTTPKLAVTGTATWWNSWGHGLYAAAGPRLRAAMGPGYLHRYVTACARGVCVRVRLTTSCACNPDTRIIDLSLDAFSRLADPSLGVLEVSVSW